MIKPKSNLIKFTTGIFFVLQIIAATVILTCPRAVEAATTTVNFKPQVSIPGSSFVAESPSLLTGSTIASYIGAIYNYGMAIAGILATLVLMGAGVIWLTSGGDSGKITQAKELISGSIAGLLILVVSWVILNTVNPDLVNLKSIAPANIAEIDIAAQTSLVCCSQKQGPTKTAIKLVDGKRIATEGNMDGKEIRCGGDSVECPSNKVCLTKTDEVYSCFEDNLCCECVRGILSGPNFCKNNVTIDSCKKACKHAYLDPITSFAAFYDAADYVCPEGETTCTKK